MSLAHLVFYILVGFGISVLVSVIRSLTRGKPRSAWKTVRVYLILVAIYSTVLVAFKLALPIRALTIHEAQYAGDWSIAVANVRRVPHDVDEDYEIDFRLGNRGTTTVRGPDGLVAYLLSDDGRRYDAIPAPSEPSFHVPVNPRRYAITTRKFVLPTNLNRVELVVARTGFQLAWFLVGRSPLDGRTVVLLNGF